MSVARTKTIVVTKVAVRIPLGVSHVVACLDITLMLTEKLAKVMKKRLSSFTHASDISMVRN